MVIRLVTSWAALSLASSSSFFVLCWRGPCRCEATEKLCPRHWGLLIRAARATGLHAHPRKGDVRARLHLCDGGFGVTAMPLFTLLGLLSLSLVIPFSARSSAPVPSSAMAIAPSAPAAT